MKKYCYIPTGNQVWFDVAVDLYKRGIAIPVLWLGDDRHYTKARDVFGDAVLRKQEFVFYPERIEGIHYKGENVDFFMSENYLRAKDRCLKMMDRLDLYGTFGRLDREAIFNKLSMWALKKIEQTQPEAMVVSETPHSHTYYLIYEICLYLDLQIVKFNTWPTIPLLFLQDMKTGCRFRKEIVMDKYISQSIEKEALKYVEDLNHNYAEDEYELLYMKSQRLQLKWSNKITHFIKTGLLIQIKEIWFQIRMYFNQYYYPINPYMIGVFGRFKIKKLRKSNLLKALRKAQKDVDLQSDYIYFALHYEPERTTNPDGDIFHDQILAICRLRSLVPENINIFVKEHPTQFYMADRGTRGRSPLFYDCVNSMDGVQLASIHEDSIKLIKNSIFVSTITGSTAFEAAIIGKQALIFGDTWFNKCPNVTLWDETLSFNDIVKKKISSAREIIDFLLIEKKLYGVPGCLNFTAEKRAANFLNDSFSNAEFKGVSHLLESFFAKL